MSKKKPRKRKAPLTAAQRRDRRERRAKYRVIFINGKQKRVPREPAIDGMPVNEFIARNADPIWLHQAGLWHSIPTDESFAMGDPLLQEPAGWDDPGVEA